MVKDVTLRKIKAEESFPVDFWEALRGPRTLPLPRGAGPLQPLPPRPGVAAPAPGERNLLIGGGQAATPGLAERPRLPAPVSSPAKWESVCQLGRSWPSVVVPKVKRSAQHRAPGEAPGADVSKIYSSAQLILAGLMCGGWGRVKCQMCVRLGGEIPMAPEEKCSGAWRSGVLAGVLCPLLPHLAWALPTSRRVCFPSEYRERWARGTAGVLPALMPCLRLFWGLHLVS